MRGLICLMFLTLSACGIAEGEPQLVTIQSPDGSALSLRELPGETLRSVGLAYGLSIALVGPFLDDRGYTKQDIGSLAVWFALGIVVRVQQPVV